MSKILMVDDDAFVVELYTQRLRQAGYEVEGAADGLAGVKLLHSPAPDLVILDLTMPRYNGFELLSYIRARTDLKQVRVVVLSNYYFGEPERQAASADAD